MNGTALVATVGVLLALGAGCSGSSSSSDGGSPRSDATAQCAKGLEAVGSACIPIFDDCKVDEVPLLGGGCNKVGVEQCPGGIKGPPDWTCKPIGLPAKCLAGWTRSAKGWCEPIVPATPCPSGQMAVIGKPTCQPIGDCGSGTWGAIKPKAGTLYVDQAYAGGGSDGSQAKPFRTINAALKWARIYTIVAVAAGMYKEDVVLRHSWIVLQGRCAEKVRIEGQGSSATVKMFGSGQTLRGVTVTGPMMGVRIERPGATVEQVAVERCCASAGPDAAAVLVLGEPQAPTAVFATIRDSRVDANGASGLLAQSAKLTVERVVIRDGRPTATNPLRGYGATANYGATLHVSDSVVTRNTAAGIFVQSATAIVERSAIVDTRVDSAENRVGFGVGLVGAKLTLRDSLVRGNIAAGVSVGSSEALIERSALVLTLPSPALGEAGQGLQAHVRTGSTTPSKVTLRDSLVAENHETGVSVGNSDATIERCVVRDTRGAPKRPWAGFGLQALIQPGKVDRQANVTVSDTLVANSTSNGISVIGSKVTLTRTVVRDTSRPKSAPPEWTGIGLVARPLDTGRQPEIDIADSLFVGNTAHGVYATGATVVIRRSVIRDTRVAQDTASVGAGLIVGPEGKLGGSLDAERLVIANNTTSGLWAWNVPVTLTRSVVRGSRPDPTTGRWGTGVEISRDRGDSRTASLIVSECVIVGNATTGVHVLDGANLTIERSIVRDTAASSRGFGDGVVAERAHATLANTLISGSARAGLIFVVSGGGVRQSVLRGGKLGIALEGGAKPTIVADNVFEGNDGVVTGRNLQGTAVPKPPTPGI